MSKTITASLALATAALWSLTGCEDNREPTKAPAPAPTEQTTGQFPMLKTPVVVTAPEPAAPAPAEPETAAPSEPAASAEPAEEASAAGSESQSAASAEAPIPSPQETATAATDEPAATSEPDSVLHSDSGNVASMESPGAAGEPTLADILIDEAEKAGWTTHRDEQGNVFVIPPGAGLPSQ